MDAVESAQALIHMTDEGSMQLPQPVTSEMDENIQWVTDGQPFAEQKGENFGFDGERETNMTQLMRQTPVLPGGDAAKTAVAMVEQTDILQKNLVDMSKSTEYTVDTVTQTELFNTATQQAEMFAATVPEIRQMVQGENNVFAAAGDMQLQTEQQRILMQQVQNNTAGQSRNVQVTNHLNPNISITFGDVRESADVDEVARRLRLCLLEEMQRCGEGVW